MTLLWDGLRVDIPAGMEPAVLDRGFVRLAGADLPVLDLRFGPEKSAFDPDRDGRRLLKASGMDDRVLAPYRPSWACLADGGMWSAAGPDPRLFVLHFKSASGVAAALFSSPPAPGMAREVLTGLHWKPADAWRPWRCFDLTFETPPGAVLSRAAFHAGAFRIEFTLGRSAMVIERLAPADVLLAGADLATWLAARLRREHDALLTVVSDGHGRARFSRPVSPWRSLLPWPAEDRLSGCAHHDGQANRIFILTTRGRPVPAHDFERTFPRHAAAPIQN